MYTFTSKCAMYSVLIKMQSVLKFLQIYSKTEFI